jgi:glutamate transport system substrate-binding protein
MNRTRTVLCALAAVAIAALTACGSEGGPATEAGTGLEFPVATQVSIPDSPTLAAAEARGRIHIGVKNDQPGLGLQDSTTGEFSGFDIEIARMVAAGLGFGTDRIDYVVVPSAAREDAIGRGDVDIYVGSYTINDKRKQRVGFAGPYLVTGQSLLVRADENTIDGPQSLRGRTVCSVTGSTPIQRVRDQALTDPARIVEFQTYSQCVDQLLARQVDVVTTDQAALVGYAAQDPQRLKVVGQTFSTEPYGIGTPRDDTALRHGIDDLLTKAIGDGTWQRIYDATLGKGGVTAAPPTVDRY